MINTVFGRSVSANIPPFFHWSQMARLNWTVEEMKSSTLPSLGWTGKLHLHFLLLFPLDCYLD